MQGKGSGEQKGRIEFTLCCKISIGTIICNTPRPSSHYPHLPLDKLATTPEGLYTKNLNRPLNATPVMGQQNWASLEGPVTPWHKSQRGVETEENQFEFDPHNPIMFLDVNLTQ